MNLGNIDQSKDNVEHILQETSRKLLNKGNNKITELRTILQRESQNLYKRQNQSTTGKLRRR